MTRKNKISSTQIVSKDVLEQLYREADFFSTDNDNINLAELLRSINSETTPPMSMSESDPVDMVLNIKGSLIENPETGKNKLYPPIQGLIPSFTSRTVTFPTTSGNDAVPSAGANFPIVVTSGNFLKVGISVDSAGDVVLNAGTQGATEALATVPTLLGNVIPLGYVLLENVGGTIQDISNDRIFQYTSATAAGGGSEFDQILPDASTLGGTYQGSVTVEGSCLIDTNTIILQNLRVDGDLVIDGETDVTIYGNLFVNGLLTLENTSGAVGVLTVIGDTYVVGGVGPAVKSMTGQSSFGGSDTEIETFVDWVAEGFSAGATILVTSGARNGETSTVTGFSGFGNEIIQLSPALTGSLSFNDSFIISQAVNVSRGIIIAPDSYSANPIQLEGDLYCNGVVHLPSDDTIPGPDVKVGGDIRAIDREAEVEVSNFSIDLRGGDGGVGAAGGNLKVGGSVYNLSVILNGRASTTTTDVGGRGGNFFASGFYSINYFNNRASYIETRGGVQNTDSATLGAGRGGDIIITGGDLIAHYVAVDGGSISNSNTGPMIHGGRGGDIRCSGDLILNSFSSTVFPGFSVALLAIGGGALGGGNKAVTGGNGGIIVVDGDLIIRGNGEIRAHGGQSRGSGNFAGLGGSITVAGDLTSENGVFIYGGGGFSSGIGARGGIVTVRGDITVNNGEINLTGGSGTNPANHNTQRGGELICWGFARVNSFGLSGGSALTSGFGGNAGTMNIGKDLICSASCTVIGGNSIGANAGGGAAGGLTINGKLQVLGDFTIRGGNSPSGVAGRPTTITVRGGLVVNGLFTFKDGTGTAPSGTSQVNLAGYCAMSRTDIGTRATLEGLRPISINAVVTLKVGQAIGKGSFANHNGVQSADQTANVATSFYTYDRQGIQWVRHTGAGI